DIPRAVAGAKTAPLERPAAVLPAGAVEVPPAGQVLHRVTVGERVGVAGAVVIRFEFGEPVRPAVHQEVAGVEQPVGDAGEPAGELLVVGHVRRPNGQPGERGHAWNLRVTSSTHRRTSRRQTPTDASDPRERGYPARPLPG